MLPWQRRGRYDTRLHFLPDFNISACTILEMKPSFFQSRSAFFFFSHRVSGKIAFYRMTGSKMENATFLRQKCSPHNFCILIFLACRDAECYLSAVLLYKKLSCFEEKPTPFLLVYRRNRCNPIAFKPQQKGATWWKRGCLEHYLDGFGTEANHFPKYEVGFSTKSPNFLYNQMASPRPSL